jgi:Kelch motif
MHNVPFGSSYDLSVIFSGRTVSWQRPAPTDDPPDLLDFKYIYIYHPATKTFHNQTATGTRPPPRIRFCSVGTPGSNGRYKIFIYGGYDPSLSTQQMMPKSDEVFVLSLPGFVWFKADYPHTNAQNMHTCNIVGWGGSQMVVTGGVDLTLPDGPAARDSWANGINIFDLSAMRWKDTYEANDVLYQTPSVVRDWYTQDGPYPW